MSRLSDLLTRQINPNSIKSNDIATRLLRAEAEGQDDTQLKSLILDSLSHKVATHNNKVLVGTRYNGIADAAPKLVHAIAEKAPSQATRTRLEGLIASSIGQPPAVPDEVLSSTLTLKGGLADTRRLVPASRQRVMDQFAATNHRHEAVEVLREELASEADRSHSWCGPKNSLVFTWLALQANRNLLSILQEAFPEDINRQKEAVDFIKENSWLNFFNAAQVLGTRVFNPKESDFTPHNLRERSDPSSGGAGMELNDAQENRRQDICNKYYPLLQAHGVESGKGGLATVVSIMIEGGIEPSVVFGKKRVCLGSLYFKGLDPSLTAGLHGPYYIIVDKFNHSNSADGSRTVKADRHIAYIVPRIVDRLIATRALNLAVADGMMTREQADSFIGRIITYDDIIRHQEQGSLAQLPTNVQRILAEFERQNT